ncbi:MAG: M23 family metallopeptidase [Aggregatilineales bacterium]
MKKMFTRWIVLIVACLTLMVSTATQSVSAQQTYIPRPAPSLTLEQDGISVSLLFETLPQGGVGVVNVTGEGLSNVRASFLDDIISFFPVENEGFYGILAASMSQNPNGYMLDLVALREGGTSVTFNIEIPITIGAFIRETVSVGEDRSYLVSPEIERAEFSRMDAVVGTITGEILWDATRFTFPIDSELTSPYGSFRVMNETTETRHTGWDLRAGVGTPVMAMGAGRVAFAGLLDIRGYQVIIDHGYGVFSGYSHFSQVHVTQGQDISAGQIIGMVGNTGRSSGAHLHWEVMVNGYWINSADFVRMWMPY